MKRRFAASARAWACALVAAGAANPTLARAEPSAADQCIAAAEQSQPLRHDGKLRAARQKLLACSRPECPAVVRADCTKWLADLDGVMPKVVLSAVDSRGADLADVRVSFDGEIVAQRLDGKEIEIDPGTHTVRFERAGSAPIEQQVVVRETERHRVLTATFASARPSSPEPLPSPEPQAAAGGRSLALPITLIGAGAAGVAVAA
jgi:hypothetical protein